MFKELSNEELKALELEASQAIEKLQNHFIALALKGNKEVKSQELFYRSIKVAVQQGCTKANIGYVRDKMQLADIFLK
jgi:beta-galactosidase beta subunit